MDRALIVSCTEKSKNVFADNLLAASITQIIAVQSCGDARRTLLERDFDLIVIDAPLRDESGEKFARHIVMNSTVQVILAVSSEFFDAISAICENDGVLTIAKPVNQAVLWATIKLAIAAQNRLRRMHNENSQLKQKIEDIRIIDRAKCLLISHLSLSEKDAHKFIEKQSMDMRVSKREIAEDILKTYIT
ncbi:MAG: ANTAR domain-containing protein [Fibromonadales bacterium]|nr:ANTAR domain-containing protein [Fibromonadales bacterium]